MFNNRDIKTKSSKDHKGTSPDIPEWIKRMRAKPPRVIYKGKGFTKSN